MKEKNKLIQPPPSAVILFYDQYQSLYGKMLKEKLIDRAIEGVPSYTGIRQIIKDMQEENPGHILAVKNHFYRNMKILL